MQIRISALCQKFLSVYDIAHLMCCKSIEILSTEGILLVDTTVFPMTKHFIIEIYENSTNFIH